MKKSKDKKKKFKFNHDVESFPDAIGVNINKMDDKLHSFLEKGAEKEKETGGTKQSVYIENLVNTFNKRELAVLFFKTTTQLVASEKKLEILGQMIIGANRDERGNIKKFEA